MMIHHGPGSRLNIGALYPGRQGLVSLSAEKHGPARVAMATCPNASLAQEKRRSYALPREPLPGSARPADRAVCASAGCRGAGRGTGPLLLHVAFGAADARLHR